MENKIKDIREQLNISREELAKRAEISINGLRELEHGKIVPTVSLAIKIAEILNLKLDKLF